ncbi:MAG: EAL domain-containing protein [Gemmatimonadetes bacterium]|nr:EAL domain-containing protein [Gemmatimonadota bacterium]
MSGSEFRWREILRKADIALQGSGVGVWESGRDGRLRPLAANLERPLPAEASDQLESALRDWKVQRPAGRRWVASRLDEVGRWCIAPVRAEPPGPPPSGVERRGRERMTLELAGLCIGLIETQSRASHATSEVLRQNRARLALLAERAPAILWTTDRELRITSAYGAGLRSLGLTPPELVGIPLLEAFRGEIVTHQAIEEAHRRALAGDSVSCPIRWKERYYDLHVEPLRDHRGGVAGIVGVAMDVTDRESAIAALRQSKQELEDFLESAAIALHWAAPDGTILRVNQAELDMLGYTREQYVGRNVAEFHVEPAVADGVLRALAGGGEVRDLEARLRHQDGSIRYVLISANGLFEAGRFVHTRCFTRDVTERRRVEDQLTHGALHDPLTGLPNRALFIERVSEALERAGRQPEYRFAVLFLDFDHFKVINDSLGHIAGDRLLVAIARRLQNCTRPGDLVARLGGDEFTLLLEDVTDANEAERAAERLLNSLAAPFEVLEREVFAGASIGVALSSTGYQRPEDVLRDADIAMYRAKGRGRARSEVFDVAMRDRVHARLGIETDLRRALDRGQMALVFQPIVELKSGRVDAFEALLRWRHPERGVVFPADFVPLAEETGLIVPIGWWVLREACRQARSWRRAFPQADAVRISVNLSARQLNDPYLLEGVTGVLRDEGLRPPHLRLEITETAIMESPESSGALLEELRWLGVGLHMDDFGTGYSSLSYLHKFPLDTIKIDHSFIRRMGSRRTDLEVVRTIVGLAQNLRMGVIAEGVETSAQRERLLALGCTLGQGFYFAEPLEPDAAGALLAMWGQRAPA